MNTNFLLNLFENYQRAQKLLGKEEKGNQKADMDVHGTFLNRKRNPQC